MTLEIILHNEKTDKYEAVYTKRNIFIDNYQYRKWYDIKVINGSYETEMYYPIDMYKIVNINILN